MDIVAKAATPEEIERVNERVARANLPPAKQHLPDGFEPAKVVPLTVPVEFNGTLYAEVNIRRLKGRDFLALQRMEGDQNIALLSIVTDIPAEAIAELDLGDFINLTEAAEGFLPQKLVAAAATISVSGQDSQP